MVAVSFKASNFKASNYMMSKRCFGGRVIIAYYRTLKEALANIDRKAALHIHIS